MVRKKMLAEIENNIQWIAMGMIIGSILTGVFAILISIMRKI